MFKSQNFCHIASNNRNQVKVGVFVYRTTDSLETVLTSGYFNDRIIDINLHDLIIHEKIDATDNTKVQRNILCVVERTLENVGTSIIKSKWEGDIEEAITNLQEYIDNTFVKKDGTSVMSAPLKFTAGSFRGAVGPYLNGIEFYNVGSDGSLGNAIARITSNNGFTPNTTNILDIGSNTKKFKDLYVSRIIAGVINNGYDIAVPVTNSPDRFALKSEVDSAASAGVNLYVTGVWYAKMQSGTIPPASAEVEGRNYADFSQTDGDNNPIIVIYTYTNGAWALTETITPPADSDGFILVTSKIWDIPEQSGQQGGRIIWSYTSRTFTPYPQIISFENAALTGVPTAPTPTYNSPNNQIATKEYVDNMAGGAGGYHPNMFDWKWADHQLDDIQWLRADTFSWQSGAVYVSAYEHLFDDIDGKTLQTETIAGTTISFYVADDGHKICPSTEESNVATIYASTGVAWYYIIDTANTRFKLPRTKFGVTGLRDNVGNYIEPKLPDPNITVQTKLRTNTAGINNDYGTGGDHIVTNINGTLTFANGYAQATVGSSVYNGSTVQPPATQMYLYFYIGKYDSSSTTNKFLSFVVDRTPPQEMQESITGIMNCNAIFVSLAKRSFTYSPITAAKFNNAKIVRIEEAFYNNTYLTSVDFPDLEVLDGTSLDYAFTRAFSGCNALVEANFPLLKRIVAPSGNPSYLFEGCSALTTVNLPKLESASDYSLRRAFISCTALTTISFPSLTSVATGALDEMFYGCTALQEIHFRADAQSTIEATTGYSSKWGATNATIYFDL